MIGTSPLSFATRTTLAVRVARPKAAGAATRPGLAGLAPTPRLGRTIASGATRPDGADTRHDAAVCSKEANVRRLWVLVLLGVVLSAGACARSSASTDER